MGDTFWEIQYVARKSFPPNDVISNWKMVQMVIYLCSNHWNEARMFQNPMFLALINAVDYHKTVR